MASIYTLLLSFFLLIGLCYIITIGLFLIGFIKARNDSLSKNNNAFFSLIIPFRNEEKNLPSLFQSILQIDYPLNNYQIIFVDDHSDDCSLIMVNEFKAKNKDIDLIIVSLGSDEFGKKKAIQKAVEMAKCDYILLTDADCSFNPYRLQAISNATNKFHADLIILPVLPTKEKSLLSKIFAVEYLSLVATTIGSARIGLPLLCSGANLCIKKETFLKLQPFADNLHIQSGDDMFILKHFKKNIEKTSVIADENASVLTKLPATFKDFFYQRIRWVSKTSKLKNAWTAFNALIVWSFSAAIVLLALLTLSTNNYHYAYCLLLLILGKIIIDTPLLLMIISRYKRWDLLWLVIIIQPIYILFVFIMGIIGNFLPIIWKERQSQY